MDRLDIMSRFDITFWKFILTVGGLIIVVSTLCLLLDEWLTGYGGLLPAWARGLCLVGGLLLIVGVLAVKRKE